jgi:hypothetical protein
MTRLYHLIWTVPHVAANGPQFCQMIAHSEQGGYASFRIYENNTGKHPSTFCLPFPHHGLIILFSLPETGHRLYQRAQPSRYWYLYASFFFSMVDPFSALGGAAAIAQLIQQSISLVNGAHQIYQSTRGQTIENERLGSVIRELESLSKRIVSQKPRHEQSEAEKSLETVVSSASSYPERS